MDVDVGYDEILDRMGDDLSLLAGFARLEIGYERTFGFLDVAATTALTFTFRGDIGGFRRRRGSRLEHDERAPTTKSDARGRAPVDE